MGSYPIARLGDTGTHGGVIITSAKRSTCEGPLVARVGDIYNCLIHGPNPIVTGSPQYTCEGALTARGNGTGDSSVTACGALIISGAVKSFCD